MRVIRNHKYDFRPNLHATEFDYHLMHPSLNGKNLLDQIQDFLFYTNCYCPSTELVSKNLQKLSFISLINRLLKESLEIWLVVVF